MDAGIDHDQPVVPADHNRIGPDPLALTDPDAVGHLIQHRFHSYPLGYGAETAVRHQNHRLPRATPGFRQLAGAGPCSTIPNRSGSTSLSSRGTSRYSAPAGSSVTSSRASSPRTVSPCGMSLGSAAYDPASTSIRSSPTNAVIEPSRT